MPYIDGFVLPLPLDRVDDYRQIAEQAAQVWKEHGALEYWECVGDDIADTLGGTLSFLQMAGAKDGETVMFSWAVFESREARDAANEKIMADPRIKDMMGNNVPFDYTRMACGGFKPLVRA